MAVVNKSNIKIMLGQQATNKLTTFFGQTFSLRLAFDPKGGLAGVFLPAGEVCTKKYDLTGFYCKDNSTMKLYMATYIEETNSDLPTTIHFYGELLMNEINKEGLYVTWIKVPNINPSEVIEDGSEFLFLDEGLRIKLKAKNQIEIIQNHRGDDVPA